MNLKIIIQTPKNLPLIHANTGVVHLAVYLFETLEKMVILSEQI